MGEGAEAVTGPLVFAPTERGIDLQYAGQRTLAAVYAQGETDHVFTPQGATQIVAIDLPPMPPAKTRTKAAPDGAHAGQGGVVCRAGG